MLGCMLFYGLITLCGCKKEQDKMEKIRDLEFTVLADENVPEELLTILEEKKVDGFKLSFQDKGFLYLCVGYGQQDTGGYSITIKNLYETDNAVYFDTTLIGPSPEDQEGLSDKKESKSYPYVVVKLEDIRKPIVFQ